MTGTIAHLFAAVAVFVGGHFMLSGPVLRPQLVRALGEKRFLIAYSAFALATLIWVAAAYAKSPYVPLWEPPAWTRWVPILVMPLSAILLVAGYTQHNPTAVIQKFDARARDPAPGILKITRHPLMWAIGLWALAHIPPNGDLAALIFFAAFAVLALYGTKRIEAKRKALDPEGFERFAEVTSNVPFAALLSPRKRTFWNTAYGINAARAIWSEIGLWRITLALALYVTLVHLHPWIAGVPVR